LQRGFSHPEFLEGAACSHPTEKRGEEEDEACDDDAENVALRPAEDPNDELCEALPH
jgi:hypothetical protein